MHCSGGVAVAVQCNRLHNVQAMCRLCAGHVQVVCRPCAGRVQAMCRPCAGHVQAMCRPCAGWVQAMCRLGAGHVQVGCRWGAGHCAGHVQVGCRPCAGHVPAVCRLGAGRVQAVYRTTYTLLEAIMLSVRSLRPLQPVGVCALVHIPRVLLAFTQGLGGFCSHLAEIHGVMSEAGRAVSRSCCLECNLHKVVCCWYGLQNTYP